MASRQTYQGDAQKSSHGMLLAPGSSVWPASMIQNRDRQSTTTLPPQRLCSPSTDATALIRSHSGRRRAGNASTATVNRARVIIREGVGTRNSVGHGGESDSDGQFDTLMQMKNQWRREGFLEEASRIQAAVNAGILLGWSKADVLRVVKHLEAYLDGKDGDEKIGLNAELMELAGEEEVLGFKQRVVEEVREREKEGKRGVFEEEVGWERLRYLRREFASKAREVGRVNEGEHVSKEQDEMELFAPLFLIKVQAGINVAMMTILDSASVADRNCDNLAAMSQKNWYPASLRKAEPRVTGDLDVSMVMLKAVHYFQVPNKMCGHELEYYLRNSKTGRKRFTIPDLEGRLPGTYPGIDRPLKEDEKADILTRVVTEFTEVDAFLRTLLKILGRGHMPKNDTEGTRSDSEPVQLAKKELSDEGFLLLDCLLRRLKGKGCLTPDLVLADVLTEGLIENSGAEATEVDAMNVGEGVPSAYAKAMPTRRSSLILRFRLPSKGRDGQGCEQSVLRRSLNRPTI